MSTEKKKGISVAARKAKARKLQQHVANSILERFPDLTEDDVRSIPMGAHGQDIMLSKSAKASLHCAFECKNQERFAALSQAFDQCKDNAGGLFPIVVIKSNRHDPFAVVDLDLFLDMLQLLHYGVSDWNLLTDDVNK